MWCIMSAGCTHTPTRQVLTAVLTHTCTQQWLECNRNHRVLSMAKYMYVAPHKWSLTQIHPE